MPPDSPPTHEPGYTMKAVAKKTGLSPHVIRVWERRYGAVAPSRTDTNRRLYTGEEVERLCLLRRVIQEGHGIGQVAALPEEELRRLAGEGAGASAAQTPEKPKPPPADGNPEAVLNLCVRAAKNLDRAGLDVMLHNASAILSRPVFLEGVIAPLMQKIGDLWREGELRVAHEHLASSVVRTFLGGMEDASGPPGHAPVLLVTTPAGQNHELGALLAASTAATEGWRVTYLGPSLPAEEIAGAARQGGARAVALSIVYPADDPHLGPELVKLHRLLDENVALIVGGRSAHAYGETLDRIGALRSEELSGLRAHLESLRSR